MPVAASRKRPKPHLIASTIPAKPDRQADQQFLPIETVDQDRSLAPRRPGPANRWSLRDAALVVEENPGLPASGVFFYRGPAVGHPVPDRGRIPFACLRRRLSSVTV